MHVGKLGKEEPCKAHLIKDTAVVINKFIQSSLSTYSCSGINNKP